MNLADIKPEMRLYYVPTHANGNRHHEDVEIVLVSQVGASHVWCKDEDAVSNRGWHNVTSKAIRPENLYDFE